MNAVLLSTVILLGAPALKEKPRDATIVGEWVAQEITAGGRPTKVRADDVTWIFKADGTREIRREGKLAFSGKFVDDPKALPATLDLDRQANGEAVYLCIYKIDGDTMTLNVGWQKVARPGEFTSPEGSQQTLYVFKRVKVKD
jgi:uncharacterized protein (TIGR03067 family)